MSDAQLDASYYLRRGVYVCHTDDGVILLDLHQDRYIGLDIADVASLDGQVLGWPPRRTRADLAIPNDRTQRTLGELVANQLLTTSRESANPDATCQMKSPCETLTTTYCESRIKVGHLCAYLSALILTKARMSCLPLHAVVHRVARRRTAKTAKSSNVDLPELRRLVRAYMRLRALFLTSTDQCLADSLTLLEFLKWYRIYPVLVFGVRTRPFAAHSWVQHGHCILNDSLEHVRSFQPILAA